MRLVKFFIFCLFVSFSVFAFETSNKIVVHTRSQNIEVAVAVAKTAEQRAIGLMGVRDLQDNQGMLFVYQEQGFYQFWMKNTPTPLDILFLSPEKKIVFIAKNTTPFSEAVIDPGVPSQFVLEVKAGFADRHHVVIGDQIEFNLLSGFDSSEFTPVTNKSASDSCLAALLRGH